MTLKELFERHPEWHNLPIVVYRTDGQYDWVQEEENGDPTGAGAVYVGESFDKDCDDCIEGMGKPVLVFSAN